VEQVEHQVEAELHQEEVVEAVVVVAVVEVVPLVEEDMAHQLHHPH
jgi:hypothetical protein